MVYYFFKLLFRITSKVYFKNIRITGKHNLVSKGPVIFVANHPASFLDPLLVATTVNRKLHFIGKATLFKNKIAAFILSRFNIIPIHRKQDGISQMEKNSDTFKKCIKHLGKGKSLLIFPEGVSLPERKLKEIKTGASRIAIGALASGISGVKIVCIGINYYQSARFRSNTVIRIGKPIDVGEHYKAESTKEGAIALTQIIKENLMSVTISIDNPIAQILIERVEEMYTGSLMNELRLNKRDKSNQFYLSQSFVQHLKYFNQFQPWRVERLIQATNQYYNKLSLNGISDSYVRRTGNKNRPFLRLIGHIFFFIIGSPFFLVGFLFHFFPYKITQFISQKSTPHHEYRVAIAFSVGTFIYSVFYLGFYFCIRSIITTIGALMIGVSLPFLGMYTLFFMNYFIDQYNKLKVLNLYLKKTDVMLRIIAMRNEIINELEKMRLDYRLNA